MDYNSVTLILRSILIITLSRHISSANFSHAASLQRSCYFSNNRVDCSYRNITAIPDEFPPSTKQIYLNGNDVTVVHQNSFKGLSQLVSVNLYQNNITCIESKAFFNISTLEDIVLKDNNISEILPLTFLMLESLFDIYLDNNKISVIHRRAFEDLPKLQGIHLAGNNIHCTCAIQWFVHYIQDNPTLLQKSSAICFYPPSLKGHDVAFFNTTKLKCGNSTETDLQSGESDSKAFIYALGGLALGVIGTAVIGFFHLQRRNCLGSNSCNICLTSPTEEEAFSPVIYTVNCPGGTMSSESYVDNIAYTSHDCISLFMNGPGGATDGYENCLRDSTFISGSECNQQTYKDDYDSLHIQWQENKSTQTGLNRRPTV